MNPRDEDNIYILQLTELHLLAFNMAAKLTKTIKTDGKFLRNWPSQNTFLFTCLTSDSILRDENKNIHCIFVFVFTLFCF